MSKDNLSCQHIQLYFTLGEEDMQEKPVNQKDLEQFYNYSDVNRQQHNQTLTKKSFISEKRVSQFRARFRAKSEKKSSEKEVSNISEKLNYARQLFDYARKIYQSTLDGVNHVRVTYNNVLITKDWKKIDFVSESLKQAKRQCYEAEERVKKAESQFKNLEEAYEKQTETHKKILMKKHMI